MIDIIIKVLKCGMEKNKYYEAIYIYIYNLYINKRQTNYQETKQFKKAQCGAKQQIFMNDNEKSRAGER